MNGMTIDAPSGSVQLESGRIFFATEARDWTSSVTLAFPEEVALELQNCSKEEFQQRSEEKALCFPRTNLRVVRSLNKGYISAMVHDVHRVEQFVPMTSSAKLEYVCQLDVVGGRQSGSVVPCPLAKVKTNSFEGFDVANTSCTKIVCLVKGVRTSQMDLLNDGKRKMTTDVSCQLMPEEPLQHKMRVTGYCMESYVSDFKIDKQNAYIVVTQIDENENGIDLITEHVQIVSLDEVRNIRATMQAEMRMLNPDDLEDCTPAIRAKRHLASPQALLADEHSNSAKKPRTIGNWPSDPAA